MTGGNLGRWADLRMLVFRDSQYGALALPLARLLEVVRSVPGARVGLLVQIAALQQL